MTVGSGKPDSLRITPWTLEMEMGWGEEKQLPTSQVFT